MKGDSYFIPALIPKEIYMLRIYYFIAFTEYSEILLGKKWIFHAKKNYIVYHNNNNSSTPNSKASGHISRQVHLFHPYHETSSFSYHKWLHSVRKEHVEDVQCIGLSCLRQGIFTVNVA